MPASDTGVTPPDENWNSLETLNMDGILPFRSHSGGAGCDALF
jgi:hypothetical protein